MKTEGQGALLVLRWQILWRVRRDKPFFSFLFFFFAAGMEEGDTHDTSSAPKKSLRSGQQKGTSQRTMASPAISDAQAHIVIITYKRMARLRDLLKKIPRRERLRLTIAQSVNTSEPTFQRECEKLVADVGPSFAAAQYVRTPIVTESSSKDFSNNVRAFGSKRNSLRNLVVGIRAALKKDATLPVIIMEDDANFSRDLFEYYDAAAQNLSPTTGGSR